jgi:tetratricopeptide (TPR) repeat protein
MLRLLAIAASAVLLALSPAARAQDTSTPPAQQDQPPATPAPKPASASKKDQNKTADPNAFSEAQSEQAAQQPNAPAPQNGQQTTKPSTADQNPFPEAQSEKAAHQAQRDNSASPPPAPPKSTDDNYSSSQVKGLDMPAADASPAPAADTPMNYNPKLARKDAQIGDFYLESGNFKGAYDRFLEANRSDPGNAEAVYGLAESARHLRFRDEALRNYRLYLSALPNGPHAKEIRKALKEMGAAPPA